MHVQVVGAGIFLARVNRSPQTLTSIAYEISLSTQTCPETGRLQFSAADLANLGKLLQLLTFEITTDGNMPPRERSTLRSLGIHIERAMTEFEFELEQGALAPQHTEIDNATSNS